MASSSRGVPGRGIAQRRVLLAMVTVALVAVWLLAVSELSRAVAATTSAPFHIDFGSPATSPAAGYALDDGAPYGLRTQSNQGAGLTYGWVTDGTAIPVDWADNGRERLGTGLTDSKTASFVQMQRPDRGAAAWEIKIDDGWYLVTVGLGDAAPNYDSRQLVTAEDQPVLTPFRPTSADRLRSGTSVVNVNDGRLTLRATGGSNVKITYLTVVPAPEPTISTFRLKVDFGAASSTPAAGNVLDFGEPFGPRANGTFGWVAAGTENPASLVGQGRQRQTSGLADPRQANFVHLQGASGVGGDWQVAVPDGRYRVTVGVGDAANSYDSAHSIAVEGVRALNSFVPRFAEKFAVGAVVVDVSDQRLTVSAVGGSNTKIDFIELEGLDHQQPEIEFLRETDDS